MQDFPYVLAKESTNVSVINVRAGFIFRLVNSESHSGNEQYLTQRLVFTNDKTFVTDEDSHNLVKYRMSDLFISNLKEIQLWAIACKLII
jgi:hypothetical protein